MKKYALLVVLLLVVPMYMETAFVHTVWQRIERAFAFFRAKPGNISGSPQDDIRTAVVRVQALKRMQELRHSKMSSDTLLSFDNLVKRSDIFDRDICSFPIQANRIKTIVAHDK